MAEDHFESSCGHRRAATPAKTEMSLLTSAPAKMNCRSRGDETLTWFYLKKNQVGTSRCDVRVFYCEVAVTAARRYRQTGCSFKWADTSANRTGLVTSARAY
jgi:hypothetical protein